ncbi:hypothetical protein OJAV_G00109270 [Oryzias javanicus]|uniref:Uncharacterized protein n=1 Tax=Oryzias javanicus TaxID=123683 RepID=A0A3S2MTS3_ORYJA|nr:hypothetical protein OJAV_G00109270 [Oryzias javanicus]
MAEALRSGTKSGVDTFCFFCPLLLVRLGVFSLSCSAEVTVFLGAIFLRVMERFTGTASGAMLVSVFPSGCGGELSRGERLRGGSVSRLDSTITLLVSPSFIVKPALL